MKTKQELQAKIAKLQAKYDAMPDEVAKTGVIYDMPDDVARAWYLTFSGSTHEALVEGYLSELSQGLLFHDKESAILAGKVRAIRHRLAGFCAKAWEDTGDVLDWGKRTQQKHGIGYDHEDSVFRVYYRYTIEAGIYCLPSSDLTKLKEEFTDDELKLALTGKS